MRYPLQERFPCRIVSVVHPWQESWILIRDLPYMALTDRSGKFIMRHLPQGTHSIRFWHEELGYVGNATFKSDQGQWTTDRRGLMTVEISGPRIDLGTVKLDAKLFDGG